MVDENGVPDLLGERQELVGKPPQDRPRVLHQVLVRVQRVPDLGGLARVAPAALESPDELVLPFLVVEHDTAAPQALPQVRERADRERGAGRLPGDLGPSPMAVTPVSGYHGAASRHLDPKRNDLAPEERHHPAHRTREDERFPSDGGIPVHGFRQGQGAQGLFQDPGQDAGRRPSGYDLPDPQVPAARRLDRLQALVEVRPPDSVPTGEAGGGPAPAAIGIPRDPPRRAQDFADLIRLGLRNPGAVHHQPAGRAVRADGRRRQPLAIEGSGDRRFEIRRQTLDPVGGDLLAPDLDQEFLSAHRSAR